MPHYRHVLRCVSGPHPAFVLPEGHVQYPVHRILNAPMSSCRLQESLGLRCRAGDVVTGLLRSAAVRPTPSDHPNHRPQPRPVLPSAQILQAGRVADHLAFSSFYAPVPLVQGGGVVVGHSLVVSFLRPLQQVPDRLVQPPLVLLDRQQIVGPRSRIVRAISFWQPMASMVSMQPDTSSCWSNSGIAVISLDLASVRVWPSTREFSEAQALTMWMASLPALRSRERRRVLPSTAITCPWVSRWTLLPHSMKQYRKLSGSMRAKSRAKSLPARRQGCQRRRCHWATPGTD